MIPTTKGLQVNKYEDQVILPPRDYMKKYGKPKDGKTSAGDVLSADTMSTIGQMREGQKVADEYLRDHENSDS